METLAYPYGDVSPKAVAAARATGFSAAVTCEEALVTPGVDPLQLPRFEVKAGDGIAFGRRLRALLEAD